MSDCLFAPESAAELQDKFQELDHAAQELRQVANARLFPVLHDVGRLWQPDGAYFQEAMELLQGTFSPITVRAALENLALSLSADLIEAELRRELGRADLLETWRADEHRVGHHRGFPLGVVAQVLAGNVFLNGIVGLSQCLLTRNAALLKLSRQDSGLTSLFVRSLAEADREGILKNAVAICSWPREKEELHQVVREEADAIVVWGGESAVAAYPAGQCKGKVIHYGPRLGLGIVAEGFELEAGLHDLAWDVALWEQKACSSPRILFVEDLEGTGGFPRQVAEGLNSALTRIAGRIPPQPLSLDDKAEILSVREFADWKQNAEVFVQERSMSHTVLRLEDRPEDVPVGYRLVMVVPLKSIEDIPAALGPYRDVLQTAVLAAPASRWRAISDRLVSAGITQITAPGSAAARFLGLPHEGDYALRRLVKLVGVDLGAGPLTSPSRSATQLGEISAALGDSQ